MKTWTPAAIAAIFLIVLAVLIGGVIYLLWAAPPTIATILAAGLGFVASRLYENYRESRQRLYDRKRAVYANLLQPYQHILLQVSDEGDGTAEVNISSEVREQITKAAFDAILYASDDVVKAYGVFRSSPDSENVNGVHVAVKLVRLLRAMRKDLGHTFTTLLDVDILRMFVNFKPGEENTYAS